MRTFMYNGLDFAIQVGPSFQNRNSLELLGCDTKVGIARCQTSREGPIGSPVYAH